MLIEVGRHLKFFDKEGNELSLTRAYGVWYGMLYFPRVSTSLYEVQHIFIAEEVKYEHLFTQSINLDTLPLGLSGIVTLDVNADPSDIERLDRIYYPGQQISVVDQSNSENKFIASVQGYNPTDGSLYIRVVSKSGSSTITSWKIEALVYTFPRGADNSYFTVKWREDISPKNVFLFNADTRGDYPVINPMEYLEEPLDNGSTDEIEGVSFSGGEPVAIDPGATLYRIIEDGTEIDSKVMQLNLALFSEEESRYARTLEIYYTNLSPTADTSRDFFSGTGLNNQRFPIDVDQSFNIDDYYFNVYVAQCQSGFQVENTSAVTPGSMRIDFSASRNFEAEERLKQGGTVAIIKANNQSSIFFCTVVSSNYNPSTDTMSIDIEDNSMFGSITDFSQYKVLVTDQHLVPMKIVDDISKYNAEEAVVNIKKTVSSELNIVFGNTKNGYVPSSTSCIVVEWNLIENLQKVAEIAVYGEVEGEDERFKLILQNFGNDIVPEVGPVFREADVNEALPDYSIINEKRKELLAAGEDIFPYTGSYKGFINAIKFFGYGDLRLKEYWKNIDITSPLYGKYSQVEVPLNLKGINNENLIPSQIWKKTSKFSLVYDINELTGTFDENGEPITQDSFQFTNEEVLIKLFSLKNVLKKYFLPLNARIVDITGEGVYFDTYATESWLTQNQYTVSSPDQLDIRFSVEPKISYIEDQDNPYKKVNPVGDGLNITQLSDYSISDLANYELSSFYVNKNASTFLESGVQKIGAKVTCTAETFKLYWKDLTMSWDKLKESEGSLPGSQFTWGGLSSGDVYEMEWRVRSTGDARPFNYVKRGKVSDLTVHNVIVPYEGTYDVTLAYYLTSSGVQSKLMRSAFVASMKSSNIVGFYRASNKVNTWNQIYGTWGEANWSWATRNQGVLRPTTKRNLSSRAFPRRFKNTTWKQCVIRWADLNSSRYFDQDFLDGVENAQIADIDYAAKIVRIFGNYYRPDTSAIPALTKGKMVVFKGPESRYSTSVMSYNRAGKTLTVKGEYRPQDLEGKQITIISRVMLQDLTFYSDSPDISGTAYHPVYRTDVDGDITSSVRTGLGIEMMIPGDNEFSQATVTVSSYDVSSNKTTIIFEAIDRRYSNFNISTTQSGGQEIESQIGCSIRYFNFSTRLTPGSTTAYNGRTNIFFNDPDSTLLSLPDPSSNDVIAYWSNVSAGISFYVSDVYFDGEYTNVVLEDPNQLLPKIDTSYSIDFSDFDVDYASKWAGILSVNKWSSLKTQWKNLFSRTWGSFDYHPSYTCGFIINTVAPGGSMRINSGELFEFPNDPYMTMGDALQALRESDIQEVSAFNYTIAVYNETMGILRILPEPLSTEWPYYTSISYEVNDGYFLNSDSSGSSIGSTVNFDFDKDITSLPYFQPGNTIKIVKKDNTQVIDVIISTLGAEFVSTGEVVINIEDNVLYSSITDFTDYRVFFTPWGQIPETIVYNTNATPPREVYVPPTYVIMATAKVPGASALGYIEFDGGVTGIYRDFPTRSHTYPVYDFRKFRDTDSIGDYDPREESNYRGWEEGGFSFPPIKHFDTCNGNLPALMRSQYGPYINGSFNWNDTYIGYDHVDALTSSTVFFNLANCKISGVVDVIWSLRESASGVLLLKTKNPYFVWTFESTGNFDVEAEIIDLNGNTKTVVKKGFVTVFDSFETLQFEGCPID
jgi:hypothetical protein